MSPDESHTDGDDDRLVYLFDPEDHEEASLAEQIEEFINSQTPGDGLTVTAEPDDTMMRVEITGSFDEVDQARGAVHSLSEKLQVGVRRIVDDIGIKLRRDAYPILAQLETRFRRFILEVSVGKLGFDWFEVLDNEDLRQRTLGRMSENNVPGVIEQPLDFTTFSDLVSLVTMDLGRASTDDMVTYAVLQDLLDDTEDLDEFRSKLAAETRERTLWGEVFSKFFEDKTEWEDLRDKLHQVVAFRNAVMHHRPFRKGYHSAMVELCEQVLDQLPVRPKLRSGENIEEVRDNASELGDRLSHLSSTIDQIQELRTTAGAMEALGAGNQFGPLDSVVNRNSVLETALDNTQFGVISETVEGLELGAVRELGRQAEHLKKLADRAEAAEAATPGFISSQFQQIFDSEEKLRVLTGETTIEPLSSPLKKRTKQERDEDNAEPNPPDRSSDDDSDSSSDPEQT